MKLRFFRTNGTVRRLVLALPAVVALVTTVALAGGTPVRAQLPYGPDTCKQGYVWRDAFAGDHVCVTPGVRSQAAADNAQAASRRSPFGGPYGPDTCNQGYVWRGARPSDHVCVTPQTRDQAASDNADAIFRLVAPERARPGKVTITAKPHQSGRHLYAEGWNFSPDNRLYFYATGVHNESGLHSIGYVDTDANGNFHRQYLSDATCPTGQNGFATVVVLDSGTGVVFSAGSALVFWC